MNYTDDLVIGKHIPVVEECYVQCQVCRACVEFLHNKGVSYRFIDVYCLIGFPGQAFDECLEKLKYLIEIGCSPYPMRFRPLDSVKEHYTPPGWEPKMTDKLFAWGGAQKWRTTSWEDFK